MAGTPTTNYNIPTYADTDAPDLSGAYNDAMVIIDAQMKANADAIAEAGGDVPLATAETAGIAKLYDTGDITGSGGYPTDGAPTVKALSDTLAPIQSAVAAKQDKLIAGDGISISENKITASLATSINSYNVASVIEDGIDATFRGTIRGLCESADNVDALSANNTEEKGWPGATVPTVMVLKSYVESKMAAAGAAYTGTAPIVVDNGEHSISVNVAGDYTWNDNEVASFGTAGVVHRVNLPGSNTAQRIDGQADSYWATGDPSYSVPTIATLKTYVAQHTPTATTSVKGLVKLTNAYNGSDTSMAVTGAAIKDIYNNSLTNITVDMLKNLYCDVSTGFVVYKPSA